MHALLSEATKSTKLVLWVRDDLTIAIAMLCFSVWIMRHLLGDQTAYDDQNDA